MDGQIVLQVMYYSSSTLTPTVNEMFALRARRSFYVLVEIESRGVTRARKMCEASGPPRCPFNLLCCGISVRRVKIITRW